jgi:hypothetical protein
VLVEFSVMEQRYQAVLAVVQDGWKFVEVAPRGLPTERAYLDRPLRTRRSGLARGPIAPAKVLPAPDRSR